MRRVIFFSLISVLFINTVLAEENASVNIQTSPKKETMVFGEYLLRPKAEISEETNKPETQQKKEAEKTAPDKTDVLQVQPIQIPMAEPAMAEDKNSFVKPVKLDIPSVDTFDVGNEQEQTTPVPEVKKEKPDSDLINVEDAYKSEREVLQEKETPNPDPDTDEEKFVKTEDIEENEDMINLEVPAEKLFKSSTPQTKKVVPEKIEFEKRPIFNIPSQNHGANTDETSGKVSENFMKGAIPSTKEYRLNQQLAVKDIYSANSEDVKDTKEDVILNLYNNNKVDLDIKGRPLKYEDSGGAHSLVNVGTVFRF